jgi:predicted patatin/cPLA2 family phospholipase
MSRLPEKFPEYSIMYKTILKQIKQLEKTEPSLQEKNENELKIQRYKVELNKIKKKFPENYFDEIDYSCE